MKGKLEVSGCGEREMDQLALLTISNRQAHGTSRQPVSAGLGRVLG
jgi:hypothetical protein